MSIEPVSVWARRELVELALAVNHLGEDPHGEGLIMCGRFIQASSGEVLVERFSLALPSDYLPRYNVAPNQPVLAIRAPAG